MARACGRGSACLEDETYAILPELLVALRHSRADEHPHGDPVLAGPGRDACLPVSVAEHARRPGHAARRPAPGRPAAGRVQP
ncbi:hypothetical protein [Nonomuraea sp. NPDC003214]